MTQPECGKWAESGTLPAGVPGQRAELTERMKRATVTNTIDTLQPDNSSLSRMEGQEMTHLRQQLREMTRQKDAVIQRNERELERNVETIQQKEATHDSKKHSNPPAE